MSVHCDLDKINKRCICKKKHLQVQGVYTKGSAVYTEALAESIASCFASALARNRSLLEAEHGLEVKGLESQLVNDLVLSSKWKEESSWTFRKKSHINILEMASLLRLVQRLSDMSKPVRAVAMVDSHVTKGASSKGRTASVGLGAVLRRVNAQMVAASVYLCVPFCPTRHNPADDPTRDKEVRDPIEGLGLEEWEDAELYDLIALPKTRRWASNWVRLVLRVGGAKVIYLGRRDLYRQTHKSDCSHKKSPVVENVSHKILHFDATLGYPGEGWLLSFWLIVGCVGLCSMWISLSLLGSCPVCRLSRPCRSFSRPVGWLMSLCLLCCSGASPAMAMPVFPVTKGEQLKSDLRKTAGPIPTGRPVLPATGSQRARLLEAFLQWTREEAIDFSWMIQNHHLCLDEINLLVQRYGRLLYDAGKSYNSYAELINALTSWKPAIRRLMQGAWDLGYSWKRLEPGEHHVAMPPQILLAMVATSFLWGWSRFGGCLALGFAGLLRPGELLKSTRADLLLPLDCGYTISYGMLAIREPKSRFTNARHQSVKIDIPDLLEVVELTLGHLAPSQKLWPHSGQTFRSRFKAILEALSLPVSPQGNLRPLDPGSLRAGGATYIIQTTECGELCRRRGRWANYKMMEIYVQELSSLLYLRKISVLAHKKVIDVGSVFPLVLEKAKSLSRCSVPPNAWRFLFSS